MTRLSEHQACPSGAALVPLIVEPVVVGEVGPLRNVRWQPGPEINLVLSPPGSGATSLWRELAKSGRGVDFSFSAISEPGFGAPLPIPAGITALANVSGTIIGGAPRYCAVLDTDATMPLDHEALGCLRRVFEMFGGQSVVFCTPSVFQRLTDLRATRWQLVREYGFTHVAEWPAGDSAP